MNRVSDNHQQALMARLKMCWSTILGGHIFTDMSRQESDELCEILDGKAKTPPGLHPELAGCMAESARWK